VCSPAAVLRALRFQRPLFLLELGRGGGELAELRLQGSVLRLEISDLLLESRDFWLSSW